MATTAAAVHPCISSGMLFNNYTRVRTNFNLLNQQRKFFNKNICSNIVPRATVEENQILAEVAEDDYYSVLGLEPDATQEEIKKAYYSCIKECHPDLIGEDPGATNFCMFINEVYEVLSDPEQRMVYDEINGYALTSKNPFQSTSCPKDRVFVDEFSCIGCKNCGNTDPSTFIIDEDHGRARVVQQPKDPTLAQVAIETCPVDCIHFVTAKQLALLEDEMRRVEMVNVGIMLSGMGYQTDVFAAASTRWEKKQAQARLRAKARAMTQSRSAAVPWWQDMWSQTVGANSQDEGARQKFNKAAAAARRWREYSRKGFYGQATHVLPESKESQN